MKRKRKNRTSFGVLFWIATILLIAVIFAANFSRMRNVIDNTHFVDVVFDDTRSTETQESESIEQADAVIEFTDSIPSNTQSTEKEPQPVPETEEIQSEAPVVSAEEDSEEAAPPLQEVAEGNIRRQDLYFIRVSNDGRILTERVERIINRGKSPLTRSLKALLSGPKPEDLNQGLLSLIPEGTELLSATVQNGVAYLSFNEQFRFNPMGLEGVLAQLKQVVLTAAAFPTVNTVQILINGNVVEYLGGDGVYIGKPVHPDDFT